MKKTVLSFLAICIAITTIQAQNEPVNPFEEFGYKPKIATLSKGKYVEFYDQDTIVQIGGAVFNTVTMKIMGFVEYDTIRNEYNISPEVISRWLSPDPLTSEFPSWSPYNFVENNPIRLIDPTGLAPNEYDQVINEDGSSTTTKVSDLGGDDVDFTHIVGGVNDGKTEIMSRKTGESVMMKDNSSFRGFTLRKNNVSWDKIYDEFMEGTGPENSLITSEGMWRDIIMSPQFALAAKDYMKAGTPTKHGFKAPFGIIGAIKAGKNSTAQMIGKSVYSFYNVGDKLVIMIMDSKSVMSYSLNPLIKLLPEDWVNENRDDSDEPTPQSTTRQTYMKILDIKVKN